VRAVSPIVAAALVAGAAALPYVRTLDAPFAFDDISNIVENPAAHALDLSPGALAPALEGFPLHRWLPRLTLAVNYALGGLRPAGYHAFNLATHVLVALLALLLAGELLARLEPDLPAERRRRVALVTALVFAVHPIQTMAVTYVVQRMASLAALFTLLSVHFWIRARRSDARRATAWFAGAAAAAYLGISSKENAAVVVLLVAAFEAWAGRERGEVSGAGDQLAPGRWWAVAGAVGVGFVGIAAAFLAYAPQYGANSAHFGSSLGLRLLSQPRIIWAYLARVAVPWPGWLHLEYGIEPSDGLFTPPTTILALGGFGALVATIVVFRRRLPSVTFGLAFFLLALAVEQSFLPLDLAFEHRLYLPMFGIALAAGWALVHASSLLRRSPLLLAAPLVALLASGTIARNEQWRDPVLLHEQDTAAFPTLTGALLTLGVKYRDRGDWDRAEAIYRRLLAIDPRDARAWSNLAYLALNRMQPLSAVALAERAIELDPSLRPPRNIRALGLLAAGLRDEAIEAYRAALQADPADVRSRTGYASLLLRAGDVRGALVELQRALQVDPGSAAAWAGLSSAQLRAGLRDDALLSARRAYSLAPNSSSSIEALRAAQTP
jgi:tetratricopeptide (TPR) repeat protein